MVSNSWHIFHQVVRYLLSFRIWADQWLLWPIMCGDDSYESSGPGLEEDLEAWAAISWIWLLWQRDQMEGPRGSRDAEEACWAKFSGQPRCQDRELILDTLTSPTTCWILSDDLNRHHREHETAWTSLFWIFDSQHHEIHKVVAVLSHWGLESSLHGNR